MNERQIFEGAIEFRNPVDRRAFLDKACGGDVALRASVDALLAAHDAASQFLNVPAVEQLQGGSEKGLDRTLDHSAAKSNDEMDIDDGTDGPDLSFLQPVNKPGSIGSLGHYEILQILGQGAFGVVFRAFDEKLHRQVAVKAMNPQLAATSPPRKRFLREARSVAAIKHENIVQIYSVEEQPLPYLVMEFVQGQTLQQKLDGNGPLDVPEILHLGRQMAAGLAAAHALNMIHRDVKPGNILLEQGAEQKVKITDFGLARAADDASMTRTGVIAGTPMYMSPEQAEGRTLDARSDLFSLGSVLYQMATGRPPFRAPNTIAVLRRVVEDTPRPMSEIIADTPPWLETIVQKLLEKEPEQRFQSAKEVAELFARCQTELQLHGKVTCVSATAQTAVLPSKPVATTAADKSAAISNRWLVAAPALVVVLLLGLYLINLAVDRFYPAVAVDAPDGKPTQVSNAPAIHKFASDEWIDVIPLIEPQKDKWNVAKQTGQNAWRIEQGELVVGGDALSSKLLLPLDSDWPAYECEVEFTRRAGENGLNINLPTSNGECPVVFDPPGFAGVHLGNQQKGAHLQAGKQIVTDQRTTLRVEVHRAANNNDRVTVALNGAMPWDWTGDLNALALPYRENFPQDRRITLWIHRGGDYVFHRIRVRMLDGGVASSLRPIPPPVAPNTATVENWETYFAQNRLAAERALALGGEVTVEVTKPITWRTLKAGDPLPIEPFVLRIWSIKNSPTATNADLDVLAGLRHVLQLNVMTKSKLNAEIIPKLAALQSPVKELGLGHLQLKTSALVNLPVMPNVHVLWLSSEQVDDGWRFLRRFPGLRSLELYGAPLPDLSPLGDVPQLRTLRLTACGELPADGKVRDVPTRNPQLRILYDSAGEQKVLGTDPARIAARRLIEAGIPVDVVAADGARKNLPLAEVEQTVTNQYIVLAIPRGVKLTDELRALLTHMSLQNFKAEGLRKADSLAQLLKDRQDIEHLDLTGSDLTDAGLVLLSRIAGMRGLYLNGTRVTAAGTAAFHRAVPGCFIHSDTGNIDADYAANPLAAPPADRAASWQGWPADAPAPAIAPFNAEQAKKHQKEWADYLKVPVEHENSVGMKFVLIPPGEFLMGSTPAEIADTLPAVEGKGQQWLDEVNSEAPQHRVILTRPFYLGVTEVTQAGYEKIMGLRPSLFAKTAPDNKYLEKIKDSDTSLHPVESVSWNDAAEFCAKLSELEKWKPSYFRSGQVVTLLDGNGYRLPSEAEWEFAARSGTTSRYSAGDKEEHLLEAGWFAGNAGEVTHAVQKLKGNPFGLYDMHGNVWEWVQDAWKADYYGQYAEKPALDPSGAGLANPLRVARGGGWSAPACGCRSAFRTIPNTTFQREDFGLRIALSVDAVRSALKQTGSATALPAVDLTPP